MTKDEALKLALEALEEITEQYKLMLTESLDIQHKKYATESPVLKHSSKAITAIKEALAQLEHGWTPERIAGIARLKDAQDKKLAQPQPWEKFCDSNCVWTDHHLDCKLAEQEPVAWRYKILDYFGRPVWTFKTPKTDIRVFESQPLYTSPPQRKPLTEWIDPNDKTQKQFLPHIGERVLFCHSGQTYCGKHNGGSFECGGGIAKLHFNTWECHWMYLPAAHGIKGEA